MPEPSLLALRAFSETARSESLATAAQVLNVTPSAVSHLLRELELAGADLVHKVRNANSCAGGASWQHAVWVPRWWTATWSDMIANGLSAEIAPEPELACDVCRLAGPAAHSPGPAIPRLVG